MAGRGWIWAAACLAFAPTSIFAQEKPLVLAEGSGAGAPKQPQAWTSEGGVVDVVFAVGEEIRLHTSHDGGKTFAAAKSGIRCPNLSAGIRRGPRVARTPKAVVVTGIGGKQGKGRDGDVWAWSSSDDGATWSTGTIVNAVSGSAREGLHGMTAGPGGELWCVWLDLREKKTEIYLAGSRDDGRTWGENVRIYHSPGGSVCECCHPSVVATDAGPAVLFRNSVDGFRDMYLSPARDVAGTTFSPARKLGEGTWKLAACPMDGGMLAPDGKGGFVTVWRRENKVFATGGEGAKERLLGAGEQPWAAASSAGPLFVWTQGREGALLFQAGLEGAPRRLANSARDPVVVGAVASPRAVVCWEGKQGSGNAVFVQSVDAADPQVK